MDDDLLLKCAVEAARSAGEHAHQNWHRRSERIQVTPHDVKLKLDVECQEIAESTIRKSFPEHNLLGEESDRTKDQSKESDYLWIVDPIDGTVNFSHGFPVWCSSVAVQYQGSTLAAAIYAPVPVELYTASVEQPAMLNDKLIHVSSTSKLDKSIIFTGVDRHDIPGQQPYQYFRAIADHAQRPRIAGSAALDLCRVAAGQGDGYFESDIYIWDVAAAGLIIEKAGGKAEIIQKLSKPHQLQYLASNGLIHEELRSILARTVHEESQMLR